MKIAAQPRVRQHLSRLHQHDPVPEPKHRPPSYTALTAEISTGGYDFIMIGAGLRIVPPYFLLFEKLINVVHRHAPAATKVCFNTNPSDTADAVLRWA